MVLSSFYQAIYDFAKGDELVLGTAGTYIAMTGTFWALNCVFLTFDLYQWPRWIRKYKVQQDKNNPMDMRKFRRALRTVLLNTVVINTLMAVPHYRLQQYFGINFKPDEVPATWLMIRDLLACVIVGEVVFYYSHRLIHHPLLYKRIHKKHHEWTAPIGITAVYASIPEYVLSNAPTVLLGPLLLRSHVVVAWLWYMIAMIGTTFGHSGYHLPIIMRSPLFHDFHHYNFEGNYGSIGLMDWLHGTDQQFRKTNSFHRHRMLLSITPADQLYPTDKPPHHVIKE